MSEPMSGVASVTARLNSIQARIAALTGDAIVPTSVSGVYTTASARGAASFATVLAAAGTQGDAAAPGGTAAIPGSGGVEAAVTATIATLPDALRATGATAATPASLWAIPWTDDAAGEDEDGVDGIGSPRTLGLAGAGETGILRTSSGEAAAVDDPLAVVRPVKGRISQPFGPTTSVYSAAHTIDGVTYPHFHDGIDIAAPAGRPVKAMAAGEVIFAGTYPDGANVIRIKHADGSIALYAHLQRGYDVKVGDKVAAGQQIGCVGTTGNVTGPHLHLELLVRGKDADPEPVLERGRLPGRPNGRIDESVLGATGIDGETQDTLATFDAVAAEIPFAAEIRAAAVRAGIDPLLLASLVKAESGFRPHAVSYMGAMGLCQLMPATARAMGVEDPFDPAQNLRAGAKYLARNLHLYGRVDLALAAYQAGKGAVAAAGGIPDSPTTRHYIKRILRSWAGYQEEAA